MRDRQVRNRQVRERQVRQTNERQTGERQPGETDRQVRDRQVRDRQVFTPVRHQRFLQADVLHHTGDLLSRPSTQTTHQFIRTHSDRT